MIVLDTNVVSEFARSKPDENVLGWYDRQDDLTLYLCGPVVMEQAYGAERFMHRTGSARFVRVLDRLLKEEFSNKILDFVHPAPMLAGNLRARCESIGRALSVVDAMIAAICLAHDATLATRNVRDFDGLDLRLVNPFEAGA
jgi:predicted nucleic acid-binding protein